ncbi:tyrosine-type recombinase/integrase [Pimelobacter simplex]|uniref:tyrosine-type recombinase/integrase n=1 Tax=Nocardioides simplex TaxID=2045 RepID=UPI003AACA5D8
MAAAASAPPPRRRAARCTAAPSRPLCGCAGTLTQTPRIHDLRHTRASWLLANGVPIHLVRARLGHESVQTNIDTYSHPLPDAQLTAAEAASQAFGGRLGGGAWLGRVDVLPDDVLSQLAAAVAADAEQRGIEIGPAA